MDGHILQNYDDIDVRPKEEVDTRYLVVLGL